MWKLFVLIGALFSAHISAEIQVLSFAGSTQDNSFNKKLVLEASQAASKMGAKVTVIDLKDYPIPFYDADLEKNEKMPQKAKQLRQLMLESQVILIASPEYNGSLSAVLKNTIDWASRTEEGQGSREAFLGKKFVIMSASPGKGGGARGLVHLRQILENVGGVVVEGQITVGDAYDAFDDAGQLKDPKQKAELEALIKKALDGQ